MAYHVHPLLADSRRLSITQRKFVPQRSSESFTMSIFGLRRVSVDVVLLRAIGVVSDILSIVNIHNMSIRVLPSLTSFTAVRLGTADLEPILYVLFRPPGPSLLPMILVMSVSLFPYSEVSPEAYGLMPFSTMPM